jgi:hypothetical protein
LIGHRDLVQPSLDIAERPLFNFKSHWGLVGLDNGQVYEYNNSENSDFTKESV